MKDILLLHNIKCGGSTLNEIVKNSNKTYTRTKLYNQFLFKDYKVIISSIRNPYNYYISAIFYNRKSRGRVSPESEPYLRKIEKLPKEEYFKLYVKGILTGKIILKNESVGITNNNVDSMMKKHNIGLFTARTLALFFNNRGKYLKKLSLNNNITKIIKLENIEEDLKKLNLTYNNIAENTSRLGKVNINDYYDQELIDLIYEKDKFIFKKFNYDKINLVDN